MIRKENCFLKTQEKSIPKTYHISILFAEDFLAKVFQLLDAGEDLTMNEELCSLKLPELPPLKNLDISSLKMFPDCYRMTKGGRFKKSSLRFRDWGMMSRGRFLTAQIIMSPSAERDCSLSGILEPNAPEKYHLSPKQTQRLYVKSLKVGKGNGYTTIVD